MKLEISLSAIPLSLARPFVKEFKRDRYSDFFNKWGEGKGKNKFRIYTPLNSHFSKPVIKVPPEIEEYVTGLGMKIDCYRAGTVLMRDGKRTTKLGSVLFKRPELKKLFDSDPQRQATKNASWWVVISRHPYDIIGMSFDRGWSSCMDFKNGSNKKFIKKDLAKGTLVAYLVKDTDKNINNPTARIALRPMNRKGDKESTILQLGPIYGTATHGFSDTVQEVVELFNAPAKSGMYELATGLYDDAGDFGILHIHAESDETEIRSMLKKLGPTELRSAVENLTSQRAITAIFNSDEAEYLAANRNLTEEMSLELLKKFPTTRLVMARNTVHASVQEVLFDGGALLEEIKTPQVKGTKSNPRQVAYALVLNSHITPALMDKFSNYPYFWPSMASSGGLTRSSFLKLATAGDEEVQKNLANRGDIFQEAADILLATDNFRVIAYMCDNSLLPLASYEKIARDGRYATQIIDNDTFGRFSTLKSALLKDCPKDLASFASTSWDFLPGEQLVFLRGIVNALSEDKFASVIVNLMWDNSSIDLSMQLEILKEFNSESVWLRVARESGLEPEIAQLLIDHGSQEVMGYALSSSDDPELLASKFEIISADAAASVLRVQTRDVSRSALQNPALFDAMLKRFMRKEPAVWKMLPKVMRVKFTKPLRVRLETLADLNKSAYCKALMDIPLVGRTIEFCRYVARNVSPAVLRKNLDRVCGDPYQARRQVPKFQAVSDILLARMAVEQNLVLWSCLRELMEYTMSVGMSDKIATLHALNPELFEAAVPVSSFGRIRVSELAAWKEILALPYLQSVLADPEGIGRTNSTDTDGWLGDEEDDSDEDDL